MKILALGHRKSVGKDTIGSMIVKTLLPQIRCLDHGVADEVKLEAYNLFKGIGLQTQSYYDQFYEEKDKPLKCGWTPRGIWIKFAEECRVIDPAIWARRSLLQNQIDLLVITDMRCIPEWDLFKQHGAITVRVENNRIPPSTDDIDHYLDHKDFDHTIYNNGSMEELRASVISFINFELKPWYNKNGTGSLRDVGVDG